MIWKRPYGQLNTMWAFCAFLDDKQWRRAVLEKRMSETEQNK